MRETQTSIEELRARFAAVVQERDSYKKAYESVLLELERLQRNLFGRKAEKVDPAQVAMVFEPFRKMLEQAEQQLATTPAAPPDDEKEKKKAKPHGRRDLSDEDMPEEVIRIEPPALPEGAEQIGVDVGYRVMWKRGSWVRLRIERPRYVVAADAARAAETGSDTTVIVAPAPPEMIPRGLPSPAMLAHVLVSKFADHLPFHRQEEMLARHWLDLDRGTMCRWAEACHERAKLIVAAMEKDALANAFVIGTDATGVLVQNPEQCKRGHFWVAIADRDHVFFRYTPRHTSNAAKDLFAGFEGYLQADASSVYDVLFREREGPTEIGCWSHARRNFFSAVRSDRRALVAIGFIGKLFEIERELIKLPPSKKLVLRNARAAPVLDALRKWKDDCLAERDLEPRSPLARALRYLDRHWAALARFLEDPRLRLDNNPSELELRRLVVGRKNWLFVGSDDSAAWTCTFVSLVASCALHALEPESYLRDIFRVLPHWPQDRVLELSPKHWSRTRDRIDPNQLAAELGPLTIPT